MYSEAICMALFGMEGVLIHVECDCSNGLPEMSMVGYLGSEVREAKDRVRTAMKNTGFQLPPRRITVNLSPADLRKHYMIYDNKLNTGVESASHLDALQEWLDAEMSGKVKDKKDVMILLDSITRLTRAYNITEPSSGRTLSGGLDPAALHMPKRFFGAARNMREGGSLTILATALIDTGSKMDDIVFEEFKGTGNMELVLDRRLSERRIFPAIDIVRSGTRRDDLLLTPDEQSAMSIVRRSFNGLSAEQAVTQALDLFSRTRTNGEFVNMVRKVQWGSAPAMHNQ